MISSVILSSQEFTMLNDALKQIQSSPANPVLVLEQLDVIRAALHTAYEQERSLWLARRDHYDEYRRIKNYKTQWSIFTVADITEQHPWHDLSVTQMVYGTVTTTISGPYYSDLWSTAEQLLSSYDREYFIEDFRLNDRNQLEVIIGT